MEDPLQVPLEPMEASRAERLPGGGGWLYEPKWDGFRAVLFRAGGAVVIQSRSKRDLTRFFPEVAAAARALPEPSFVLDGELVIEREGRLQFDALLLRMHPAESRIRRLAQETPAQFAAFDLLEWSGRSYLGQPLEVRRRALERFFAPLGAPNGFLLSPQTRDPGVAAQWLKGLAAHGFDGVMAKRSDAPYRAGLRDAMVKVKRVRSADCVVGGYRLQTGSRLVGALLLGLYDAQGLLHHVGMCAAFQDDERRALREKLAPLAGGAGFTGRAPGPSRWSRGRDTAYVALRPELVCEVSYDTFSQQRFRHGTQFLRWRPDKPARECTFTQVT